MVASYGHVSSGATPPLTEKELVHERYWPAVNGSGGGKTSNRFNIGRNCQRGGCFESLVGFVLSHLASVSLESWRSKVPTVCFPLHQVGSRDGKKATSWWVTASWDHTALFSRRMGNTWQMWQGTICPLNGLGRKRSSIWLLSKEVTEWSRTRGRTQMCHFPTSSACVVGVGGTPFRCQGKASFSGQVLCTPNRVPFVMELLLACEVALDEQPPKGRWWLLKDGKDVNY